MVEIVAEVRIAASLGRVWRTFTDLTCWADWNSVLKKVGAGEGSCITGPGRFSCRISPYGLAIPFHVVVTEVEPMGRVVWTAARYGVRSRHEFLFHDSGEGGGGAVRLVSREVLRGLPTILGGAFFPRRKFEKLIAEFLEDLKGAAEREGARDG